MVPWYAWLAMGLLFAAGFYLFATGRIVYTSEDECPECGHHDHRGIKDGTCLDADWVGGYTNDQCHCANSYHAMQG